MAPFPDLPAPRSLPPRTGIRAEPDEERTPQVQEGSPEADDILLRLGGLYPSKSGNALVGGIDPNRVLQDGANPVGILLIEKVQRAMEMNRPLRFCVFENTGKFPGQRAPYTIHVAVGRPRPERPGETQEATFSPTPVMAPSPPRPVRRTAPRR